MNTEETHTSTEVCLKLATSRDFFWENRSGETKPARGKQFWCKNSKGIMEIYTLTDNSEMRNFLAEAITANMVYVIDRDRENQKWLEKIQGN